MYDLIRCIEDPEKAASLERTLAWCERGRRSPSAAPVAGAYYVRVQLTPTVPHCSLAMLIGLCVRVRLQENLDYRAQAGHCSEGGSTRPATRSASRSTTRNRWRQPWRTPSTRTVPFVAASATRSKPNRCARTVICRHVAAVRTGP